MSKMPAIVPNVAQKYPKYIVQTLGGLIEVKIKKGRLKIQKIRGHAKLVYLVVAMALVFLAMAKGRM
jgi:hypothetical protein